MRFTGHESFACRYVWLPKAYRAISEHPDIFLDYDSAMVKLGIGKNMVYSIRFWVEVMGVAVQKADRTMEPTDFGQAIFADNGFDPFLEDIRTLWLLHWNLAAHVDDPLFAWDFLLYRWPYPELTRNEALLAFTRETQRLNLTYSPVTLGQHLDIFLRTYVPAEGTKSAFEDTLDCPLVELELLQVVGEHNIEGSRRRESVYAFRREAKPQITMGLFEYCLDDYWKRHKGEATLTYRDVAIRPGSIGQVFKLPEDDIRTRLEVYSSANSQRPFSYQPSAIQGLVSRRESEEPYDFLAAVYTGEAISG